MCEHLTREFADQEIKFVFEQITPAEYEAMIPGPADTELAEMWQWMDEYGYYGVDKTYVYPKDVSFRCAVFLMSANLRSWGSRTR